MCRKYMVEKYENQRRLVVSFPGSFSERRNSFPNYRGVKKSSEQNEISK